MASQAIASKAMASRCSAAAFAGPSCRRGRRQPAAAAAKLCTARCSSVRCHFAGGEFHRSELFYAPARCTPSGHQPADILCGKKKKAKMQKKAAVEREKRLTKLVESMRSLEGEARQSLQTQELLVALAQEVAAMNLEIKQQAEWMMDSSSSSSSSSSDEDCGGKKVKQRRSTGKASAHREARQQIASSSSNPSILEQARAIASEKSDDISLATRAEPVSPVHAKATIAVCTGKKCLRQGSLQLYSALHKAVEAQRAEGLETLVREEPVPSLVNSVEANGMPLQSNLQSSLLSSRLHSATDLEGGPANSSLEIEVRESKCLGACGKGPCVRLKASGQKPKDSAVHLYVEADEAPTLLKMCEPRSTSPPDGGQLR